MEVAKAKVQPRFRSSMNHRQGNRIEAGELAIDVRTLIAGTYLVRFDDYVWFAEEACHSDHWLAHRYLAC
jgi:hypothetical protein